MTPVAPAPAPPANPWPSKSPGRGPSPAALLAFATAVALLASAAWLLWIVWQVRNGEAPATASTTGGALPEPTRTQAVTSFLALAAILLAQSGILAWSGTASLRRGAAEHGVPGAGSRASLAAVATAFSLTPWLAAVASPPWSWLALPAALGLATALAFLLQARAVSPNPVPPRQPGSGWTCPRCTRRYTTVLGAGPVPTCPQCG